MANTFFDKWVDNRNNLTEDLRPNDPRRAAGDAILSNSGGSITDMNGEKIY